MRFSIRLRNKRFQQNKRIRTLGDTLIEVTMALAILSMVLISSTVVATQSYRIGQTARERTTISNGAQGQLEALRAFRDSHPWNQFLNGGTTPAPYMGVLTAAVGQAYRVTSPCLHMVAAPDNTFVPVDGSMPGPVPTSFIEIVIKPTAGSGTTPRSVDVTVNYGAAALGGGKDIAGHIQTTLTDIGFIATPPPPPPAPPCNGAIADIALVLDTSGSMDSKFGNGQRIDASKATAAGFIDKSNISPSGNHIAVIDFNDNPRLDIGLTGDAAAAKAVIGNMSPGGGTRYVPALDMAKTQLASGRPSVAKVIVFLSDGEARDAKDDLPTTTQMVQNELTLMTPGTKIFTIGIRGDGDTTLLYKIMPMNGGIFGDATDPAKLEQIYSNIAGAITCAQAAAPPPPVVCNGPIYDIVMVVDRSSSMKDPWGGSGTRIEALKSVTAGPGGFIDKMHLSPAGNHMALIDFNGNPNLDSGFTDNSQLLKNSINGLSADDGTHYVPALQMASDTMKTARPNVNHVIVFLSDGGSRDNVVNDVENTSLTTQQVQAVQSGFPAGTKVYTVGITADKLNPQGEVFNMDILFKIMPYGGGLAYDALFPNQLQSAYEQVAAQLATCR